MAAWRGGPPLVLKGPERATITRPSILPAMSATMRPATASVPAHAAPLGPWGSVLVSAAMLATVGSTLGSIVIFGVLYPKATGWSGRLPLWEYMKLRDISEEVVLSLVMLYVYRSRPAIRET